MTQKVRHVALWRSFASDSEKVRCRTFGGGTEQCRCKAGTGSLLVFALNRCLLAFDQNTAMMGSRHQESMTPTSSQSGSLPRRQPPHRLDSKGEMKPSPSDKISERRKLAAIGVKAGKPLRLIAQELNVTETT